MRPNVEEALKRVRSRYELVHAAVKRTLQLLESEEGILTREGGELKKKTVKAIEDIAKGIVEVKREGE